jgi:hypothetical protein
MAFLLSHPDYVTPKEEVGSTHNLVAALKAGMLKSPSASPSDDNLLCQPSLGRGRDKVRDLLRWYCMACQTLTDTHHGCIYLDAGGGMFTTLHCIKYNQSDRVQGTHLRPFLWRTGCLFKSGLAGTSQSVHLRYHGICSPGAGFPGTHCFFLHSTMSSDRLAQQG